MPRGTKKISRDLAEAFYGHGGMKVTESPLREK